MRGMRSKGNHEQYSQSIGVEKIKGYNVFQTGFHHFLDEFVLNCHCQCFKPFFNGFDNWLIVFNLWYKYVQQNFVLKRNLKHIKLSGKSRP